MAHVTTTMDARREIIHRQRIVDMEFRISRLGILGKEYYDLAQIKLKRHRTQISIARTQNALLHQALSTLREKDRIARKNAGDLENLRKKAASLRLHHDRQRQRVFKRQRKLEWQITGTHSAELECAGVLDPNTSPELVIRSLESKLARVQLKMHDVQILVKHYEGTLLPLRDEWTLYDAKLATLQDLVNMKNHECELLINTHHDAIRARDAAKIELEELLAFLRGHNKKGIISPELRLKILRAIKEIKSVMDVESMREMYHQFLVQEKQSSYLESICEELRRTLDLMRDDGHRPSRRKSSGMDKDYAERVIEGTTMIVRRQSEWRGAVPLLQILESTKSLVTRLHEGQLTLRSGHNVQNEILDKCAQSMSQILQSMYRQMMKRNKEAVRKAEYEAKEAAHWAREEAEVARKKIAAEEARRKYEERAAAREAQREEEEALRRMMEESQEATDDLVEDSQVRLDDTSDLPKGMTQQETEDPVSSAEQDLDGSYDQPAKETETDDIKASTLIFLPSFPQPPSDDREVARRGSATVSSSDESEARPEISADPGPAAVTSDDESIGGASSADDERQSGRPTPSRVTGTTAVSRRFGRAATFIEASPHARPHAVSSKLGRAATFTETGRPPTASTRETQSPDVEPQPVTPGEQVPLEDSKEAVPVKREEKTIASTPAAELIYEGDSVHGAVETSDQVSTTEGPTPASGPAAELTYEGDSVDSAVETSDQVSTKGPTPGSGIDAREKSTSPELVQIGEFPPFALEVPSTTPSEESLLKEGSGTSETVQSPSEEHLRLTDLSSDVTVEALLPRSPSGAPIASDLGKRETRPSESVIVDQSSPQSLPPTPRGFRFPSLPRSPSGAPKATEFSFVANVGMHDDESVVPHVLTQAVASTESSSDDVLRKGQTAIIPSESAAESLPSSAEGPESQAANVRAAELLPSTPGEMPGMGRTSTSQGKRVAGDERAAQSPRIPERRLTRSPSGAPIASAWSEEGANVAATEILSPDESLQPQLCGGLRSPNVELPRSPSGAPVATAVRFPFGSSFSETSSPAGTSDTGRSPTETARLPSEKDAEPAALGTSDPQKQRRMV